MKPATQGQRCRLKKMVCDRAGPAMAMAMEEHDLVIIKVGQRP
jgi:hypothetical protein